jgi:hypothetical protein
MLQAGIVFFVVWIVSIILAPLMAQVTSCNRSKRHSSG